MTAGLSSSFLSTPSARRATPALRVRTSIQQDFYPRPPRGGRPSNTLGRCVCEKEFLSTPSARRATTQGKCCCSYNRISIHALREEGDQERPESKPSVTDFYPRPPRGGRQQKQRENPLLLSHYTPLCTNCKEASANQTAKSHRYLRKQLVFRCEASRKTMCAAGSHWRGIKRSAHYPAQTPGAAQHVQP